MDGWRSTDRLNRRCMTLDYPHIMELSSSSSHSFSALVEPGQNKHSDGRATANGFATVRRDLEGLDYAYPVALPPALSLSLSFRLNVRLHPEIYIVRLKSVSDDPRFATEIGLRDYICAKAL